MKKKYKLVIFDLDGTILYTLEDIGTAVNVALETNGYPTHPIEHMKEWIGYGIQHLMTCAAPCGTSEEMIHQLVKDQVAYYQCHSTVHTKPYEGIVSFVQRLQQEGIQVAVVSNKVDGIVQDLCNKYFDSIFTYTVGERDGIRKKPDPDSVNEVLNHLSIDGIDAVYIGDTEVDVQTAKNAKMDCIAVSWGYRNQQQLKECGAMHIVNTIQELEEYF